jgi:hypothetical protein
VQVTVFEDLSPGKNSMYFRCASLPGVLGIVEDVPLSTRKQHLKSLPRRWRFFLAIGGGTLS